MRWLLSTGERSSLSRALALLRMNRGRFALAVVFGSLGLGSSIALAAVSAWLIARASQMPPVMELSVAATSVRMFGVGKAVFRYLERLASHWVALDGMGHLRTEVYARLADSPTDTVTSLRRGDILTRTGADVDSVGDTVVKAILPGWIAVITGVLTVGIVGWLSPAIGLVVAIGLIISGVVAPMYAMRGARLAERALVRDRAELAAASLTLLEHASELRVSGRLAQVQASIAELDERIKRHRDASARPAALASAIDVLALALAIVGAIAIGIYQVDAGTLNGIELAVCVLTPLAAFEGTTPLTGAAVQLVRSASASQRIMDLLNRAEGPATTPAATLSAETPELEARDLVVAWPGGSPVAGPIDLDVGVGSAVAVVGESGIGKTTLLATLAGMLHPQSGTVRAGGADIADLPRDEAARVVVWTAEDAHVFETSVLENLRVARPDVSPVEASELLERAGLGPWLADLPEGVATVLGMDAATVSGGERRRLLLARALASPAPILLLDEPGEHLDGPTADALIIDLLGAARHNRRGIVLVTHRLSPLAAADTVIVLGRDPSTHADAPATVIAQGTHAELMASHPPYRWAVEQEDS